MKGTNQITSITSRIHQPTQSSMVHTLMPTPKESNTLQQTHNLYQERIKHRELVAWILSAFLLSVLLTTITVLALRAMYKYRKRTTGINEDCEMEGNPCYEAIAIKQTTTATCMPTHEYITT